MATQLTPQDRVVIDDIFESAKRQFGGTQQLFAAPLTFSDDQGGIKFQFPEWMTSIRQYLISQYGEREAGTLMLDLMSEWISLSLNTSAVIDQTPSVSPSTNLNPINTVPMVITSKRLWVS